MAESRRSVNEKPSRDDIMGEVGPYVSGNGLPGVNKKTKVSKGFRHAYKQRVMELVDIFPKAGGWSKEGQNSLGGA